MTNMQGHNKGAFTLLRVRVRVRVRVAGFQ